MAGWLVWDSLNERTAAPTPSATPSAIAGQPTPGPTDAPDVPPASASPRPSPLPTSSPAEQPTPTSTPPVAAHEVEMAFVPVVSFWSDQSDISLDGLASALRDGAGRGGGGQSIVPAQDRDAIAAALGITIAASVGSGDADEIRRAVREGALGIMRVTDVTPAVRALSVDGVSLFGNDRIGDLAEWPIRARVTSESPDWDAAATWTLVAGGDILLDRGVANQITTLGKGVDFPFDGGTARIVRIRCCSSFDWPVPVTERTGNAGAVRALLEGGDLTIANLETAVRPGARPSSGGLSFVAQPRTLDGVANAGFDFMSLANNHIHNGGEQGVLTAMAELEARGIAHAGAGRTPADARRPAQLEANGRQVAILACTWVGRKFAQAGHVGANDCRDPRFVDDIAGAAQAADVVIVFPHWGREYRAEPAPYQRRLAAAWVAAGTDVVIGAHSHWAGGIEDIDGRLVFYSLGNLVFDQNWQTETQLGLILELTFAGERLAQVRMHPTIIVDQAQPNLLDEPEDWSRVIDQVQRGSEGLLPY